MNCSFQPFAVRLFAGVFFLYSGLATSLAQRIVFTNLASEDGLASEGVQALTQGPQGFIWMASGGGFLRYDGHDLMTIGEGRLGGGISVALTDRTGGIWLGTGERGVFRFDSSTEEMRAFPLPTVGDGSKPPPRVNALVEDAEGSLWIGTDAGICRLPLSEGTIIPVTPEGFPVVQTLVLDQAGALWAGTKAGALYRSTEARDSFEPVWNAGAPLRGILADEDGVWLATEGKGLIHLNPALEIDGTYVPVPDDRPRSFPSLDATAVFKDSKGGLWFGSSNGLSRFFPSTGTFYTNYGDQDDKRSLSSNQIHCIFEDRAGVLWIGTRGGVSRFPLEQHFFERIKHRAGEEGTLSHDSVHAVFPDSQGRLWVATEDGINVSNSVFGGFRKPAIPENSALKKRAVSAFCQGVGQAVWVGTQGAGLVRIDASTGEFLEFRHNPDNPQSLPDDSVTDIVLDRNEHLWVATEGHGLALLNDTTGTFTAFEPSGKAATAMGVRDLLLDDDGRIWIAQANGKVRSFLPPVALDGPVEFSKAVSFPSGINVLADDAEGRIWIGTDGAGIFILEPETGALTNYNHTTSLLPDDRIFGIETDNNGHAWISSSRGLTRFDPKTARFRNFNTDSGLQSLVFHPRASCKDANGRLYFGGPRGLNVVDTDKIPSLPAPRSPVFTGLALNGKRVSPAPDSPLLKQSLALTRRLDIPFTPDATLTLGFATLDYSISRDYLRYRLLPLDSDWIQKEDSNAVTYLELDPGAYTFEVQSSLDGAEWSPVAATLAVQIIPPWFRTRWATTLFVLAGIGFLALAGRAIIVSRVRKAQRIRQELELERNKAEAALANEVSRSMLLQRASEGVQHDSATADSFASIIAHLQEHFASNGCSLHEHSPDPTPRLRLLALQDNGLPAALRLDQVDPANALIQRVLSTPQAVASNNVGTDETLGGMGPALAGLGIRSLLAVRTTHQGLPNGMLLLLHCDRSVAWVEGDIRLIEAIGSQLGTAIANRQLVLEDARQKRELAEAREVADVANKAKSEFLSKMTHELRTPLNAILGFSQLLEDDESLTDTQHETLRIINGSGEHLLEVINDVLDIAKIEAGGSEIHDEEFDLFGLLDTVEKMLAMKAKAQGLALRFLRHPGTPRTVRADKGKLRQILVNLLGNSLKFTAQGGVTVRVAAEHDPLSPSKTRLHFEIEDTGVGVAEEELPKLFEKFGQTESGKKSCQGTGLGLPITKSFVELLGGTIRVQSRVGIGTTFYFDIPCEAVATREAAVEPVKAAKTPSRSGRITGLRTEEPEIRILIAEDQPTNRLLLATILKKAGFTIGEAENGRIAVDKWRAWRPHLIFMDQEMPVLNGNDATREIVGAPDFDPARTTIISLTAHALEDSRRAALDAGCADFLPKPFKHEELYAIIEKHLPLTYEYGLSA